MRVSLSHQRQPMPREYRRRLPVYRLRDRSDCRLPRYVQMAADGALYLVAYWTPFTAHERTVQLKLTSLTLHIHRLQHASNALPTPASCGRPYLPHTGVMNLRVRCLAESGVCDGR